MIDFPAPWDTLNLLMANYSRKLLYYNRSGRGPARMIFAYGLARRAAAFFTQLFNTTPRNFGRQIGFTTEGWYDGRTGIVKYP
jgi:hypothetical protein